MASTIGEDGGSGPLRDVKPVGTNLPDPAHGQRCWPTECVLLDGGSGIPCESLPQADASINLDLAFCAPLAAWDDVKSAAPRCPGVAEIYWGCDVCDFSEA